MIVIEQTQQFKHFQLMQRYQRQTSQLATYLVTAMFIEPSGRQLSAMISPELSIDNSELVLNWVRQEVCCVSCLQEVEFKVLQRDFVRWLLSYDIPVGELQ